MKMLFVMAGALLPFVFSGLAAKAQEECEAIPITAQDLEREATGYSTVSVLLFFDWNAMPEGGIRYPIRFRMDSSEARPDLNRWIQGINSCLWWTEYVVVGERRETRLADGTAQRSLWTPLLLPDAEIGHVEVATTIRGIQYRGRWETAGEQEVLVLVPSGESPHF